jgi:hypothetical protein
VSATKNGAESEIFQTHDGVHSLSCETLLNLQLLLLLKNVMLVLFAMTRC